MSGGRWGAAVVRQHMKNWGVVCERLRLPGGRFSHAAQSAHAQLLKIVSSPAAAAIVAVLIVLLITIQRYFDHGAIPSVTRSLTPFIVTHGRSASLYSCVVTVFRRFASTSCL